MHFPAQGGAQSGFPRERAPGLALQGARPCGKAARKEKAAAAERNLKRRCRQRDVGAAGEACKGARGCKQAGVWAGMCTVMHVRGRAYMCKCVQACKARVQNGIAEGRRCMPRPAEEGGTGRGTCAWGGGNTSGVWGGGHAPGKPGRRGVQQEGVHAESTAGGRGMQGGACNLGRGARVVREGRWQCKGRGRACNAGVHAQCKGGVRTVQRGGACNAGGRRGGCSARRRGLEAVWHPGGGVGGSPGLAERAGSGSRPSRGPPPALYLGGAPRTPSPGRPRPPAAAAAGPGGREARPGRAGTAAPAPSWLFFFLLPFYFYSFSPPLLPFPPSPSPPTPLPRRFPTPLSPLPLGLRTPRSARYSRRPGAVPRASPPAGLKLPGPGWCKQPPHMLGPFLRIGSAAAFPCTPPPGPRCPGEGRKGGGSGAPSFSPFFSFSFPCRRFLPEARAFKRPLGDLPF